MEILPDSTTRIKSRGLLTWVCLMGISRIYPWLRFQASEELKDYGPEDLEAHEAEDVRPRKVESI